jgi:hypothetical protein
MNCLAIILIVVFMGISVFCPQFLQTQNVQLTPPPLPFNHHLDLIRGQGLRHGGRGPQHGGIDAFWRYDV